MKLSDFKWLFHSDILTLKSSSNPFWDYWVFDFDTGTSTSWEAGEHGIFTFPEKIAKKQMRPMSIASISDEWVVKIGTRTGSDPSLWKQKITSMKPGDKIKIRGPFGPFKVQDKSSPVVMIAGGIWITPFRAIMKQLEVDTSRDIVLLYSAREGYLFKDEFDAIAKKNPRVKNHYITGREELGKYVSKYAEKYWNEGYYFSSGTPEMIKTIKNHLSENGIFKNRMLSDSFHGY